MSLAFLLLSSPVVPARIARLPERPEPYRMRDWRAVAQGFTRLVLSYDGGEPYLPLRWDDEGPPHHPAGAGPGLPSYVGHPGMTRGAEHEAIAVMGVLLGASLVGEDVRELVPLMTRYGSEPDGVVLNRIGTRSGQTFWYEVFPGILFAQLSSRYPAWTDGRQWTARQADRWAEAVRRMGGDFNHTAFDLRAMRPVDNGRWREPDAAGGLAYLLLGAGPRHRAAARAALTAFAANRESPTYELLSSYGALAAARMNAEEGTTFDVKRMLDWSLEPSVARPGWGMVEGRWERYDVGGLIGSTTDGGGYAFTLNTFVLGGNLAPLARYDDRFSPAVAKWFLNAANAARLFYGVDMPPEQQSTPEWTGDPRRFIPFEGLRREWKGRGPVAMGDGTSHGWAATDRCVYAGGFAGLFGAVVRTTNVPMILSLDLRATDHFAPGGFPTRLLYNPHAVPKTVALDVGASPVRIWDAVVNRTVAPQVRGRLSLPLAPGQARQLVLVPANLPLQRAGGQWRAGGRVVDFRP